MPQLGGGSRYPNTEDTHTQKKGRLVPVPGYMSHVQLAVAHMSAANVERDCGRPGRARNPEQKILDNSGSMKKTDNKRRGTQKRLGSEVRLCLGADQGWGVVMI